MSDVFEKKMQITLRPVDTSDIKQTHVNFAHAFRQTSRFTITAIFTKGLRKNYKRNYEPSSNNSERLLLTLLIQIRSPSPLAPHPPLLYIIAQFLDSPHLALCRED